jgi:hypothetical protein
MTHIYLAHRLLYTLHFGSKLLSFQIHPGHYKHAKIDSSFRTLTTYNIEGRLSLKVIKE